MLHLAPGYGSFQQVTSLFGPEAAIAGWARLPHIIEEDHPSLALDDKHPQSEALAEYLSSLGWPILLADGEAIQWSSVLGNLALNAIPAILLRNKSYTIDRPEWWAWEVEVMREALGVLQKAGVPLVALPGRDVPGLARAWGTLAGEALQDYMRAFPAPDPNLGDSLGFRSNHGDYLYGAIAVLADGLGWQAPLNHALALKLSDEYKQWPSYDPVGRAKTLGAILRLARP
jgi:ketopantoate reductase